MSRGTVLYKSYRNPPTVQRLKLNIFIFQPKIYLFFNTKYIYFSTQNLNLIEGCVNILEHFLVCLGERNI